MFKKLADASMGKYLASNGPAGYKKRHHSVGPRSLNISNREKEIARIERENIAFAKKLTDNKPSISKHK